MSFKCRPAPLVNTALLEQAKGKADVGKLQSCLAGCSTIKADESVDTST